MCKKCKCPSYRLVFFFNDCLNLNSTVHEASVVPVRNFSFFTKNSQRQRERRCCFELCSFGNLWFPLFLIWSTLMQSLCTTHNLEWMEFCFNLCERTAELTHPFPDTMNEFIWLQFFLIFTTYTYTLPWKLVRGGK